MEFAGGFGGKTAVYSRVEGCFGRRSFKGGSNKLGTRTAGMKKLLDFSVFLGCGVHMNER